MDREIICHKGTKENSLSGSTSTEEEKAFIMTEGFNIPL